MTAGVARRHLERVGGNIGRRDLRGRRVHGNRKSNRARTGADVEHARIGFPCNTFQRRGDYELGLRPRNQHGRADFEIERIKFFVPDDISDRLALFAPRDHRFEFFQYCG